MGITNSMEDAGQDGRNQLEPKGTDSPDIYRYRRGSGPVEVPPIELHSESPNKQISALERKALDSFDEFNKRTRELFSYVKHSTSHLFENYPMQTIAGIAGIAFTVGVLLRITRSNYE